MALSSLSPGECIIYATTRIVAFLKGKPTGTGTGFYYGVDVGDGKSSAFIVTNKHVIEGCDGITFTLHTAADNGIDTGSVRPSGKFEVCGLTLDGGVWMHPNSDVDLCAIPIAALMDIAVQKGVRPFVMTMTKGNIPAAS